jgi:hypothetical protein
MTHAVRALGGAAVAVALLAAIGIPTSPVTVSAEFDRPLVIPPLAESGVAEDGTRVFRLTAQEGKIPLVTVHLGRSQRARLRSEAQERDVFADGAVVTVAAVHLVAHELA